MTAGKKTIDPDVRFAMHTIEETAAKIADMCAASRQHLKLIEGKLIGSRIRLNRLSQRLTGEYQITAIEIDGDGTVIAHGLKVRSGGQLGDRLWLLGQITIKRLDRDWIQP